MKKRMTMLMRSLLFAAAIISIAAFAVSAAPLGAATSKTLSTNYTLVNLSTTDDATVAVSYVKDDGSAWAADAGSTSFSIPKNFGQKVVAQYFDATMTAGKGSATISSNAPLGAVVQILARNQTPTSGAYSGITTPSNKYYVPLVQRKANTASGLANSQVMVQNTEATATQVTMTFVANPATAFSNYNKPAVSIPAGATLYYDLSDESATNLPDGWNGSVVVTAETGKKIGVIVNLFTGANSLMTYNAFPQENVGTDWAVPLFTSRLANKLSTPVAVQNLSGGDFAASSITMNCKSTSSTPATLALTNSAIVKNNATYYFNPVVDATIPALWTGSCLVHAPGNAVVFVQMRQPGASDNAAAYEAFLTSSTNTSVVVPLMSKHQANGFATVATIQNLCPSTDAPVTLIYTPSPSYPVNQTVVTFDATIPAGGNIDQNLRFNNVTQLPNLWFGTLQVVPRNGSTCPLVSFVQLTNWMGVAGDTLMSHGAISLP